MSFLGIKSNREFYRTLLSISIPIVLQDLITSSFSIVDNVMIGQLGDELIAASGMANQIIVLMTLLVFGTSSGTSIFIAQFWGKHDMRSIKRVIALSIWASVSIAAVFFVASFFFTDATMSMLSPDPNVIEYAGRYLRIVAPAFFCYALSFPITFAARSVGQPKVGMSVGIGAILLNTALNYTLIFGKFGFPMLGIAGAAIATLISKIVELVLIFALTKRYVPAAVIRFSDFWGIPPQLTREVFKKAIPVILNEGIWSLGLLAISVIYSWYSTEAVAAFLVTSVVMSFFTVFSYALGSAAQTILGNALGAGQREKSIDYNKKFLTINVLIGIVTGVVIYFTAPWIVNTFYRLTPAASQATIYTLWVIALVLPFKFFTTIMMMGTFRAGGDTLFGLLLETACIWLVAVPIAYAGVFFLSLPIHCVVLLVNLEEIVKILIGGPRVFSGRWANVLV